MDDILKSIKASLYDRSGNPTVASFFISWLVVNYNLLLIAFSDIQLKEKLDLIESYLHDYSGHYGSNALFYGIIVPFASAVFFLTLLPWVTIPINWVYYKASVSLKTIYIKIRDETPISGKRARELNEAVSKAEALNDSLTESVREKNIKIEDMNKKNEDILLSKDKEIKELNAMIEDLKSTIDEHELEKTNANINKNKIKEENTTTKIEDKEVKSEKKVITNMDELYHKIDEFILDDFGTRNYQRATEIMEMQSSSFSISTPVDAVVLFLIYDRVENDKALYFHDLSNLLHASDELSKEFVRKFAHLGLVHFVSNNRFFISTQGENYFQSLGPDLTEEIASVAKKYSSQD